MAAKALFPTLRDFLGMSNEELAAVDTVVMNCVVAKGIQSLANLDIGRYVDMADEWEAMLRSGLPNADAKFYRTPHQWDDDIDRARLSYLSWFLAERLKIRYREDLASGNEVYYTDPTALFLCGIMDSRRGTCGSMATLFVALARRLGWPISLACIGAHFIARLDDGIKTFNVETSLIREGGMFAWATDEQYIEGRDLPRVAIDCGSELRAVTPREMLGLFVGLRARHLNNLLPLPESEADYLLARYLFPTNRYLYIAQNEVSVQTSIDRFEPHEKGHPVELAQWLQDVVATCVWADGRYGDNRPGPAKTTPPKRPVTVRKATYRDVRLSPEMFTQIIVGHNPQPRRSK